MLLSAGNVFPHYNKHLHGICDPISRVTLCKVGYSQVIKSASDLREHKAQDKYSL